MTTPVPLDVRPDDVNLIALVDGTGDSITMVLDGEQLNTRGGNNLITRGGNNLFARTNQTLSPIALSVREDNLNLITIMEIVGALGDVRITRSGSTRITRGGNTRITR